MQRISKSVGKGGKNEEADVKTVQELLNKFTKIGGYGKLDVDGKVGKGTINAISAFQEKAMGIARPDGLVEPGKNTFKKLNDNPASVAKDAKANDKDSSATGSNGKVIGKTSGVGNDIVKFLEMVAKNYGITIVVTSGFRSPEGQGIAMFENWIDLKRGDVYRASTLSAADKKTLDGYYVAAVEDEKAASAVKKKAQDDFVKLAAQKVGKKSKHSSGRAVDVRQKSISASVYAAITTQMSEVKEGNRKDIYHFESDSKIPEITDEMKAKWPK